MTKMFIHTRVVFQWNKRTEQYDIIDDIGYVYDGPIALAGGAPTKEWTDWGFYDDGTEAGSVIIGSKNTNPSLDVDTIYFFRAGIHDTAGNKWNNPPIQLQYNHNAGGWNDVNATSSVVQSVASGNITDDDDTTQRMTSFDFIAANEGIDEVDGVIATGADPQSNGFEVLFSFQILSADVANNDTIQIQVVDTITGVLDSVNQALPTITVNEGVDINVQAGVDALALTTYPATVSLNVNVQAGVDALALTTYPATISVGADVNVQAGVDALVLTTYPASVILDVNVQAVVDALVLTTYPATVSLDVDIQAGIDALALTAYPATISLGVNVLAGVDALVLTTYPATITLDVNVLAGVDALTLTAYPATISVGADVNVEAGVDALVLTTYPATIAFGTNIQAGVDALTLTTYPASIALDVNVQAGMDALVLTMYSATVAMEAPLVGAPFTIVTTYGYIQTAIAAHEYIQTAIEVKERT